MLNFLKSGKVNLTVTIDRDSQIYYPGDPVKATVTLESARELKIRAGHVALVCQEDFQYCYETTDSDGDSSTSTMWGQTKHPIEQRYFLVETTLPANTRHTDEFSFSIPPAAPPTGSGSIFRLKWIVEARLDRKLAGDLYGEAEAIVMSTPPGQLVTPGEYGESNEPYEAELAFFLPGQEWVRGQTLAGEFRVHPHNEFTASEVRIELVQREYVPHDEGNLAERTVMKVKLAGKTQFRTDQPQAFPLQMTIPDDALPTTVAKEGSIKWRLKGILARTLRSDTHVDEEIMVYTAPSG